ASATICRRTSGRLDFEFLNQVNLRQLGRIADKVIVVITTIHEEIVGSGKLAIGRKTRHVALATLLATATARYRHPWVQARQLCEVAPIQRQIFDLAVVNNFAQLGTLRLSENRVALDRD